MDERRLNIGTLALNVAEGPRTGPPLLLLHAGSGDWHGWGPVASALADRWHVLAPDLRGHGRSDRGPQYRIVDYAQDIEALIDDHLDEAPVIAGHSLGGHVAVAIAARDTRRARAVIVGDAPFDLARTRQHIAGNRPRNIAWRELAASGEPASVIAARLPGIETPVPGSDRVGTIADVVPPGSPWYTEMGSNLAHLDPAMLDAVIEFEEMHAGLEDLLPAVRCPVLFVQGNPALGGLLDGDEVARWLNLERGDRHVQVDETGHELFLRDPDRFTAAVRPFLEAVLASNALPGKHRRR